MSGEYLGSLRSQILEEFSKILAGYLEQNQHYFNQIDKIVQNYVSSTLPNINKINERFIAQISKSFPPEFFERLQRELDYENETSQAFKQSKWPLSPSIPKEHRAKVVILHRQGKSCFTGNVIRGYFLKKDHKHTKSMVSSWEAHPLFSSRMDIIKDALEAHCSGKYTLSVPAFLPMIEGILTEYLFEKKMPVKYGKAEAVATTAVGDLNEYPLSSWSIAQTLLYILHNSFYIWTNFDEEIKKPMRHRGVSRHTIAHGISANYNTYSQSLKLLLLLDAVFIITSDIE